MRAVVCVKFFEGALSPFDGAALESALRLCEDVTVLTMAPLAVQPALAQLTRLGVKQAILLCDAAFSGADTLATSYALSMAVRRLAPDYVFCGRQSLDGDTAQVGPCLAKMIAFRLVANVLEFQKTHAVTRDGNAEMAPSSLFTVERICALRFPSIRSHLGEAVVWGAADIGADMQRCGVLGSPTKVLRTFESTRGRRTCEWITREELLPLLTRLKTADRKQSALPQAVQKLKRICTVGTEVSALAAGLAEEVCVIAEDTPENIAAQVAQEEIVLWSASPWGRNTAPQVAALLRTGLCADCTQLETDGTHLFMYRPARSGSITAKIQCNTLPQMATLRVAEHNNDIIVSCGRGADFTRVSAFATEIGADIGASRALVDEGKAPYALQIGLTGKAVSPKIYIAIGISGAVQHTCAIEHAGTVIAINPDKSARIFDFADYGIVAAF